MYRQAQAGKAALHRLAAGDPHNLPFYEPDLKENAYHIGAGSR